MIDVDVLTALQTHTVYAEDVLQRLEGFGYTANMADVIILKFVSEKTINRILTATNQSEIPEELNQICVDMICGEFLSEKNSLGQLGDFNVDDDISSVTMGDVTVQYEQGASQATKLMTLVEALKNPLGGDLICYRKFKW